MKICLCLVGAIGIAGVWADGMKPLEYEVVRVSPCADGLAVARDKVRELSGEGVEG